MYDLDLNLGAAKAEVFAEVYPAINNAILHKNHEQDSRYGNTKEELAFKMTIENPQKRCVGGYNRDMNIFFLLAEALWIWMGKKDVAFLEFFNSRMKEFSDDGVVFHAPYGYRMRSFGQSSKEMFGGSDQLKPVLHGLDEDNESRRFVLQIWNASLDLGVNSKDIPCNDLLFLKIRNGELNMTIANRSNDLHWGLPTNLFQFSFLLEIMARILGVQVGQQVHNSDSLHLYLDNPIAERMEKKLDELMSKNTDFNLYDVCSPSPMTFNFTSIDVRPRLQLVDDVVYRIISGLESEISGGEGTDCVWIRNRSEYLSNVHNILQTYVKYKKAGKTDKDKYDAFTDLLNLFHGNDGVCDDYYLMGLSWYYRKIKDRKYRERCEISFNGLIGEQEGRGNIENYELDSY